MPYRRRRHRWITLLALIGLLFQQFAMAVYVCPQEIVAATQSVSAVQPCHAPDDTDQARCHEHCHPTTASADHIPSLTVPPALLPATSWIRDFARSLQPAPGTADPAGRLQVHPPTLNVQFCTLQI